MPPPPRRRTSSASASSGGGGSDEGAGQAKRDELRTYRALGLDRAMKSRAGRARVEKSGMWRIIGGMYGPGMGHGGGTGLGGAAGGGAGASGEREYIPPSPERPPLQVLNSRYVEVRLQVLRECLERSRDSAAPLPPDLLARQMAGRIEAETYDRLAAEVNNAVMLEEAFIKTHGRKPMPHELARFAAATDAPSWGQGPPQPQRRRGALIDGLLARVADVQQSNPARLQTAWAAAVGPDAAATSFLDKVDPLTGIAWFRCLNSALTFQLQRRPGLAQKLSQALGTPVKMLKAAYR